MFAMEIYGFPLDISEIRAEALLFATKTREETSEEKILRVSTILFHLTSRQSVAAVQWEFLPNELVRYLAENAVIVKKEFLTYNTWNMFGLPVEWQIIKCRRVQEAEIFSILIDASFREKGISHCEIYNTGTSIRAVTIQYLDNSLTSATIRDTCAPKLFALNLYSTVIVNGKHGSHEIVQHAQKFIVDKKFSNFISSEDFYRDSFPELDDKCFVFGGQYTEAEANADFDKIRKYFELFQQLLRD
jgi:hypothetical protein